MACWDRSSWEHAAALVLLTVGCAHPAPAAAVAWAPQRLGPGDSIYFVMVDRYANGDPSNDGAVDLNDAAAFHGGDLHGVLSHLDDIQKLGFTTVWLSPVWKMRTAKFFDHGAFHGYWVDDFTQLEPRFGDRPLLRRLSDELHRRGMKLLLDVVLNHVGFDSPLLTQHPDWFHHLGNIKDWNNPEELVTHDVMGLPDLAQEKEEVYQYLLTTSERWIDEIHPDGFRLDAVKHVSLSFWARYTKAIREHAGENFWMLGEALEGDPEQVAHVQRAGGFDSMFDFPLYYAVTDVFCKGAPLGRLAATLSQDSVYPDATSLVTLADNHDLPRLLTACGGDRARAQHALEFLFATRGIPSLTYGTEIGLTGEREPANRGDMRFDGAPLFPLAELQSARRTHLAISRASPRVRSLSPDRLELEYGDATGRTRVVVSPQGVEVVALPGQESGVARSPREVVLNLHSAPIEGTSAAVAAGTTTALGNWNPQHGLGLRPVAEGIVSVRAELQEDAVYAFKFAVRHADGSTEWESHADRYLLVEPGDGPLILDATWGS